MKLSEAVSQPNTIAIAPGISPGAVNVSLSAHGKEPTIFTFYPANGSSPSSSGRSFTEAAVEDPDTEEMIVAASIQSSGF